MEIPINTYSILSGPTNIFNTFYQNLNVFMTLSGLLVLNFIKNILIVMKLLHSIFLNKNSVTFIGCLQTHTNLNTLCSMDNA